MATPTQFEYLATNISLLEELYRHVMRTSTLDDQPEHLNKYTSHHVVSPPYVYSQIQLKQMHIL